MNALENPKELIARVDESDTVLWLKERSEFYQWAFTHRSIGIIVINIKKEVLICQRALDKKRDPGVFSHSVDWGVGDETYYESAMRELLEELWIQGEIKELYKYFYERAGSDKMRKKVFICNYNGEIKYDANEIAGIEWIKLSALKEEMNKNANKYAESFIRSMDIFMKRYETGYFSL